MGADAISTSLGVITCDHCGSLHQIPTDGVVGSGPTDSEGSSPARKPERLEIGLPSRFKVRNGVGGFEVSWSAGGAIPGFALAIIATGFAYVALTSDMWFLLIASAGLFYFAATRAFNKHRVRVDGARLEVTQGPLPWPGARKLNASDIEQLYATEHEARTETDEGGKPAAKISKYYRLLAKTRTSGNVAILSGLRDPLQALWLEQEIERVLGIDDKQVAGEHLG